MGLAHTPRKTTAQKHADGALTKVGILAQQHLRKVKPMFRPTIIQSEKE